MVNKFVGIKTSSCTCCSVCLYCVCKVSDGFSKSSGTIWSEPPQDKTNKMICAPNEDSDQPGHPPSLIRAFAVRSMGSWGSNVSLCGQRRLWSGWADAQADLSLRWAQKSFCWFVMRRLISPCMQYLSTNKTLNKKQSVKKMAKFKILSFCQKVFSMHQMSSCKCSVKALVQVDFPVHALSEL